MPSSPTRKQCPMLRNVSVWIPEMTSHVRRGEGVRHGTGPPCDSASGEALKRTFHKGQHGIIDLGAAFHLQLFKDITLTQGFQSLEGEIVAIRDGQVSEVGELCGPKVSLDGLSTTMASHAQTQQQQQRARENWSPPERARNPLSDSSLQKSRFRRVMVGDSIDNRDPCIPMTKGGRRLGG